MRTRLTKLVGGSLPGDSRRTIRSVSEPSGPEMARCPDLVFAAEPQVVLQHENAKLLKVRGGAETACLVEPSWRKRDRG